MTLLRFVKLFAGGPFTIVVYLREAAYIRGRYLLINTIPTMGEDNYKVLIDLEENKRHKPNCLECGTEMPYGRPDRKFCCKSCKNRYHNKTHAHSRNLKIRVGHILDRNYSILNSLVDAKVSTLDLPSLLLMGFNPLYNTFNVHIGRSQVQMCFDIRYNVSSTRIFRLERVLDIPK